MNLVEYFQDQTDILNENKLKESENITLIKDIFISKVINPIEMIYDKITNGMSEDKLNIMTLSAPMGIGKTASLKKVKSEFEKKIDNFIYSGIEWRADIYIDLIKEQCEKIIEILELLDELDDVQNIYINANLKN